jgi:exosortase
VKWGARALSGSDKPSALFLRHLGFLLFLLVSVLVFWTPLRQLISFSFTHDYGSHITFIVPVSAYLIYLKQDEIFSKIQSSFLAGSVLLLAGGILSWLAEKPLAEKHSLSLEDNYFSLLILAVVIVWMSGFLFFYGPRAFRTGSFPLLFLLLLVPIPEILIDKITFFLQAGSAAVAYGLLRLLQVPVFKQGFFLHLPTLNIEVAKECSGIRSSLALLITTLLVGEFALRSGWRRLIFVLSAVPVLILKNGVRITAICLLSIYVDRGFLTGWLHMSGGIVFFSLGLAILVPILTGLRRSEEKENRKRNEEKEKMRSDAASALPSTGAVTARQR